MANRLIHSILILLLLQFVIGATVSFAQSNTVSVFTEADTMALHNAMQSASSDADLSAGEKQAVRDSLKKVGYGIERFKHMLELKKDILWSENLSTSIKEFEDSTYISVYPMAEVRDRGVLIAIVNRFSTMLDGEPYSPYVSVVWEVIPLQSQQLPFKLVAKIEHSPELPDAMFTPILEQMTPLYLNKTFQTIEAAGPDILQAMNLFLEQLGQIVGTRYAPKYLFEIEGETYLSGRYLQIIAEDSASTDSILYVNIIKREDGSRVFDNITWSGVQTGDYDEKYVQKRLVRDNEIKAYLPDDTLSFTVKVWDDDLREQLEGVMFSLLDAVLEEMLATLERNLLLRQQHMDSIMTILQMQHENCMQVRSTVTMGSDNGQASSADMVFLDINQGAAIKESAPAIDDKPVIGQYRREAAKYAIALALVKFAKENREALIRLMQPGNLREFKDLIVADIGRMSANVIASLLSGDEESMKSYLRDFLIERLNRSTAR